MSLLNIAEICPATHTLGPGQRFAIWVQGCCFRCQNCISPDWIPMITATLIEPKLLADMVLSTLNTEGITVSGGEPMLQAEALLELFTLLREQRDISIICFTGFTIEQLRSKGDRNINQVLNTIDVLIDGQYIQELNDNKGWRGSSNQVVHFLSPRYLPEASLFLERERNVEIHLCNDAALMVGIPPHNFQRAFEQTIENLT
ncbi:4Fe-4S single cluster domain-containing protein [Nostoc sp. 2RC]|uniref:4Fe-4S single cluster domain-containing protein n=1 Tax=Nostoc sp. 2RC TaxID=2485484 RepID=UPI0016266FFC|nr:4Fe-4S single cluster domain-containing protein [Nostoc sp. 2RC]MBC1238341.1 radical SAM protein [Nostoc sp. 2RC]